MLKNLFERVKLNKWSLIARRMEEEYGLAARTGKQCRERYSCPHPGTTTTSTPSCSRTPGPRTRNATSSASTTNSATSGLSSPPNSEDGTPHPTQHRQRRQEPLFREAAEVDAAHKQDHPGAVPQAAQGPKAQRFIQDHRGQRGALQEEPPLRPRHQPIFLQYPRPHPALKNQILAYAYDHAPDAPEDFQHLIQQVHDFGRDYKRKPKQLRRVASSGPDLPELEQKVEASPNEDSEDEIVHPDPLWNFQEGNESESAERKMHLRSNSVRAVASEVKEEVNVEQLLQNKGLLEEDESPLPPLPGLLRRYTSSEFLIESAAREPFFCK